MDADWIVLHAELLLFRRALCCDLPRAAYSRTNASMGDPLLVALGRARAGCILVHAPLSDRSRAMVPQFAPAHSRLRCVDDCSSRDLFDHRLAAARCGLQEPQLDPGLVFIGHSV